MNDWMAWVRKWVLLRHPNPGDGRPRHFSRGVPTMDTGKGKKGKGKSEGKGGKGKDLVVLCGWCERPGAKRRCGQCKVEFYCNQECQQVSVVVCRVGPIPPLPPPPSPPFIAPLEVWPQERVQGLLAIQHGASATSP